MTERITTSDRWGLLFCKENSEKGEKMISIKNAKEGAPNHTSKRLKSLTVSEFIKNNRILIVILVAVLLVSLAVFIFVFWNNLGDVGAWGSIVAGVFTYLGSSFLGVVVFYNTQCQQRQKEIEDQIVVEINYYLDNYEDPDITVHLTLFHASITAGTIQLLEHNAVAWIIPDEIPDYDFCPADKDINERITKEYKS